MKLAWFTPMDKDSGIGRYSVAATNAICECGVEVDIFHSEKENLLQTKLPCKLFSAQDINLPSLLSKYDFIVYCIGDYLLYHEQIYEVSKMVPGIVQVNDFVMHHFMAGYYIASKKDPDAYVRKATELYGNKELFQDSAYCNVSPIWESDRVMEFPFFEPMFENALGVIYPSKYTYSNMSKSFSGISRILYAPYLGLSDYPKQPKHSDNNRQRVFAVCNNPNKLTHIILEAIGQNPIIKEKIDARFVGSINVPQYMDELEQLIKKYSLQNCVTLTGRVSDEEFVKELSMCDVAINLRDPPMEGGSAALMEQLWAGKPTIVLDHGFYGEMPDDCVYKISPNNAINGLANALSKLLIDDDFRNNLGIRAYEHSHKLFDPKAYAEGFLDFLDELIFNKPIEHLIMHITHEMQMMRVPPKGSLPRTVAREIEVMFSS